MSDACLHCRPRAESGSGFRVLGPELAKAHSVLGDRLLGAVPQLSDLVQASQSQSASVRPSQARSDSVHHNPTPSNSFKPWTTALLVATLFALAPRAAGADAKRAPGLVVTFTSGERRDSTLASEVALYVEAGKPPTPFLPGGKFTATWEGAIHADLRGNYQFQAEVSGALKVEINGAVVLDATSTGDATPLTKPIQLNKGANAFKAAFTAPASGDAFTRLGWTEKGVYTTPIPAAAFTRSPSPELLKPAQLRLGRELFLESRCIRCHTDTKLAGAGLPELNMDAPSLEAIGARRRFEWMAQWLLDPKALRPS